MLLIANFLLAGAAAPPEVERAKKEVPVFINNLGTMTDVDLLENAIVVSVDQGDGLTDSEAEGIVQVMPQVKENFIYMMGNDGFDKVFQDLAKAAYDSGISLSIRIYWDTNSKGMTFSFTPEELARSFSSKSDPKL